MSQKIKKIIEIGVQTLLRKFYYLINIFSMKKEVCICNISLEGKICCLHDGIINNRIEYYDTS